MPFLERVQRQDLLRDHRDHGQRHAQVGHEVDKILLLRWGGLVVCAAGAWIASRVLSFRKSVR
jgi:hypothetical protein